MPNNFRITGSRYISKDGNDANAGTTADLPKATWNDYVAGNNVAGCGVYKGAFNVSTDSAVMLADGYVVLDCTGTFVIGGQAQIKQVGSTTCSPTEIRLNGFNLDQTMQAFFASQGKFENCIIKNGVLRNTAGNASVFTVWAYCALKDITSASHTRAQSFNYCSFFNCSIVIAGTEGGNSALNNSYIDTTTSFSLTNYFGAFNNNCYQGTITVGGVTYELKRDKDGNAIDPNPAIQDWINLDPNVYTNGNFSQDPEFVNVGKEDFKTVASTSPLLFASSTSENIGGVIVGTLVKAVIDTALLNNLVISSGDFIYDTGSGAGVGDATFTAKQIAPIPQLITYAQLASILNFNSDQAIGTGENTNVPAVDNFASGTAGANPRRLTYEMRWSVSDSEPVLASDWENDGLVTPGDFTKFEHFQQPLIDVNSIGNGDPAFVVSGSVGIRAKWVQLRPYVQEGIG